MTLNLSYRLRRLFQGESGVVERVEPVDVKENYYTDDDWNLPERIFVRNHLGELVDCLSPMSSVPGISIRKGFTKYQVYKKYKPGDKFP